MIWKAVVSVLVVGLLLVRAAHAQPPQRAVEVIQTTHYQQMLNDFEMAGCLSGATLGGAAAYSWAGGPLFSLVLVANGCSLGSLLGPVGLWINDVFTGDNAFDRLMRDFWAQVEAANRASMMANR